MCIYKIVVLIFHATIVEAVSAIYQGYLQLNNSILYICLIFIYFDVVCTNKCYFFNFTPLDTIVKKRKATWNFYIERVEPQRASLYLNFPSVKF